MRFASFVLALVVTRRSPRSWPARCRAQKTLACEVHRASTSSRSARRRTANGEEQVNMKVREVMQRNVTTIGEGDSLGLARQVMLWAGLRHLPVVSRSDDQVVGMLGEHDLLRALAQSANGAEALACPVRDFAVSPVEHIGPDAELVVAAAALAAKKLGCLLVLENGQLLGMLTGGDVLAVLTQVPLAAPAAAGGARGQVAVHAIMYPEPIAVRAHETLLATAARMAKRGVRHACVVDEADRLLGIISDRFDECSVIRNARSFRTTFPNICIGSRSAT
jgi:CBS domain-containing protein